MSMVFFVTRQARSRALRQSFLSARNHRQPAILDQEQKRKPNMFSRSLQYLYLSLLPGSTIINEPSHGGLLQLIITQGCIGFACVQATRAVRLPFAPFPFEHDAPFLHQLATAVELEVLPAPNVYAAVAVDHPPLAVWCPILPVAFIRSALVSAMYGCVGYIDQSIRSAII